MPFFFVALPHNRKSSARPLVKPPQCPACHPFSTVVARLCRGCGAASRDRPPSESSASRCAAPNPPIQSAIATYCNRSRQSAQCPVFSAPGATSPPESRALGDKGPWQARSAWQSKQISKRWWYRPPPGADGQRCAVQGSFRVYRFRI